VFVVKSVRNRKKLSNIEKRQVFTTFLKKLQNIFRTFRIFFNFSEKITTFFQKNNFSGNFFQVFFSKIIF